MKDPETRYRESYRIRSYETDPRGFVTPRTLCQLLQEAATGHAAALAIAVETLLDRGVAWVLSRLQLEVGRWPRGGEEITVETWPHAASRLVIERRFRVLDGDGAEIAHATTLWVVMDLERRRPIRLPDFILEAIDRLVDPEARPVSPDKLAALEEPEHERRFEVRYTDLDMVRHVNNALYVQWAVESVPEDFLQEKLPAALDVHFLGECRLGDTVVSRSRRDDLGGRPSCLHLLVRDDGTEVARAGTRWTAAPPVDAP
jgi:acyl-ACP thioesterase